ncbi:hypothetical protein [Acetobacter sp. A11-2]|uniref:hypothetical protein n=1 Tax=Acetobacter sp. A11-2 TaxID=3157859 RepID=UPI0032F02702
MTEDIHTAPFQDPRLAAEKSIVDDAGKSQKKTNKDVSHDLNKGMRERVELDGRRKFFDLREQWSAVIIIWIFILILFNISLSFLVGWGSLNFKEYKWFITSVTVETFLQIVGMGYVAVKFLFSDGKSVIPFEKTTSATKTEDK